MANLPRSSEPHGRDPAPGNLVVLPRQFCGDDAALVAAVRAGHPGARAEFFNRFAPQIERIITHVIGFDRELSDILQETFTNAVASLNQLESPAALKPWLFRIAAMAARKTLRSRSRRSWLRFFSDADDEAHHEPLTGMADPDDVRGVNAVYAILDELPTDERVAFALRFIEGMELTEVATASGVSLATVKRRLKHTESRFVAAAQRDPTLSEWLERNSRWQSK
jgi:RNA polymerase sigma-70 factor (ECF subfamily)